MQRHDAKLYNRELDMGSPRESQPATDNPARKRGSAVQALMVALAGAVLRPRGTGHMRLPRDLMRVALGMVGFIATAFAARGQLTSLERWGFVHINQLPNAMSPAVIALMQLGSFPAVFVAAGLALIGRRPRLAVALASGGTAVWLLAKVVKTLVERGRPADVLTSAIIRGGAQSGLGFPSGHAAVAAFIMTVSGPYLTRPVRVAGWMVVWGVAMARLYVGAHLPLDAVGGVLFGWGIGSLVSLALGRPRGPHGEER